MKPLTNDFFSDRKTPFLCLHTVERKVNFKSHFDPNLRNYNVHNTRDLPARETKLLQKLLKSRAKYEDARHRVISEGLLSLDRKGKKVNQPIAAPRVQAIIQLVTAIDRGGGLCAEKVRKPPSCVKSPFRMFTRSKNKGTLCCTCPEEQKPMSSEICAEKPRRKTNIFLKRIVKKSNNRTTCVQVEAIESIDDDDCPQSRKEPCDGKELLKSLKNTLPKECRNVVQSCPKIDSSSCNDSKKLERLKCLPCIAKRCFRRNSNSVVNPSAQKRNCKNVACQGKIPLRRKSAQAKFSITKKGTCTEPPPGVTCYAKIKAKNRSQEQIKNKSGSNSHISNLQKTKGKEKTGSKQPAESKYLKCMKNKVPEQLSDSCTCNKVTQTKKPNKKSKSKNDKKAKESVNNTKLEKKKKVSLSADNLAENNKRGKSSKQSLPSTEKKKKRTKSEIQVKSKCLPCNKCSKAVSCCDIVNQSNRKVNTGFWKILSKSCVTSGQNRNKAVTTTFPGIDKPKTVCKQKTEKKRKEEKKQKEEKISKADKKSKQELPKKCQLVRLGSNFSLQIEFYKDNSDVKPEKPEKLKNKRNKQENKKEEKAEKKSRSKNKHSVTAADKPTKMVTKSTKTKRTCCSLCYFAKVDRFKPKFKPEFAAPGSLESVNSDSIKSKSTDNCDNLDFLEKTWSSSHTDTHSSICLKTFSVESIVRDCYFENHYLPKSIYTLLGYNNSFPKDFVLNYSNMPFLPLHLHKKKLKDHSLYLKFSTIDSSFFPIVFFSILHVIQFLNVRTVILNFLQFQNLCFLVYFLLKIHNFSGCVLFIKWCFIYFYILVCTLRGKGV